MTQVTDLLAQGAVKGTLILAAGFLAAWLPTRASAAFRHYAWTLTFAALLLLPPVMALAPRWSLPLPAVGTGAAASSDTVVRVVAHGSAPASAPT